MNSLSKSLRLMVLDAAGQASIAGYSRRMPCR